MVHGIQPAIEQSVVGRHLRHAFATYRTRNRYSFVSVHSSNPICRSDIVPIWTAGNVNAWLPGLLYLDRFGGEHWLGFRVFTHDEVR